MYASPKFLPAGDTALVIEFGDTVDRHLSALVLALAERLEAARLPGVIEQVPTFRSLMVHFEPLVLDAAVLEKTLSDLVADLLAAERTGAIASSGKTFRLPACYDPALAPDLDMVAARTGLTPEGVVECHSAEIYHVYMLGYLPGFPYMGDVPDALKVPKLDSPRVKVPVGGIALAGALTAVYPVESPGGWNLIGRSPVAIWDLRRDPPALFAPGDKVRFEPVSLDTYHALARRAAEGTLVLAPEPAREGDGA